MKNDKVRIHKLLLLQSILLEIIYKTTQKLNIKKRRKEVDSVLKTFQDLKDKTRAIYEKLVAKYPEFVWAEKYVDAGLGFTVHPITSLFMLETRGIHSLLTDEATLNDIILLLCMGIPVTADIRTHQGTPHTIEISSFSSKRHELYFKGPLGNYNTKYKITAHSYCYMSYNSFSLFSLGNPSSILIMLEDKKSLEFIKDKIFKTKKYYIF